ncbi:MAG: coproporphyrinogen dehydrogenase HemZ [Clostridia bacterium]|nr:coproporphyrinogen dehydrogenase HemZ [Clostridia bacterium]MBQ7046115.1 coproporphyrinogen dehydrogenase HemZ [Oscillospiraceae bacterium]
MILYTQGHDFHYEMENLCRVFFPNEKITVTSESSIFEGDVVTTELIKEYDSYRVDVKALVAGAEKSASSLVEKTDESVRDECERTMARELLKVLSQVTGYTPPWGILTGVRPSKLMMRLVEKCGEEGAYNYFINDLLVTDKKAKLALNVAKTERRIIDLGDEKSFSLYISIPFCPSRCSYCSFVSHSITNSNAKKLLPVYVDKLCEELAVTGEIVSDIGLRLESIYMGGGTPGILSAEQMSSVCSAVMGNFDLSSLREYTVEVGRPETVSEDKLSVLRDFGVDRVSINPQTLSDSVLEAIGRKHTVEDFFKAYELARRAGFEAINVDLIAGLPSDTIEGFTNSVDGVAKLNPANVTVHTLALKSASTLKEHGHIIKEGETAGKMTDYSQRALTALGYIPYYMYRQSRCVGNLENVGWCLSGKECLYNVFMMEESHTVLATGAGAVTKLKSPQDEYIERIFNYKYPYEYNTGFDELMKRKGRITEFYREKADFFGIRRED